MRSTGMTCRETVRAEAADAGFDDDCGTDTVIDGDGASRLWRFERIPRRQCRSVHDGEFEWKASALVTINQASCTPSVPTNQHAAAGSANEHPKFVQELTSVAVHAPNRQDTAPK
jgi:hypothetical protein